MGLGGFKHGEGGHGIINIRFGKGITMGAAVIIIIGVSPAADREWDLCPLYFPFSLFILRSCEDTSLIRGLRL